MSKGLPRDDNVRFRVLRPSTEGKGADPAGVDGKENAWKEMDFMN